MFDTLTTNMFLFDSNLLPIDLAIEPYSQNWHDIWVVYFRKNVFMSE